MTEPLHLKKAFARYRVPEPVVFQSILVWAQAGHNMLSVLSRGNPVMPLALVAEFEAMSEEDLAFCEEELAVCVELASNSRTWAHLKALYAHRAAEERPDLWPQAAEPQDPDAIEREAAQQADDDAAAEKQAARVESEMRVTERRRWEAEEAALADAESQRAAAVAAFVDRAPHGEVRDRLASEERERSKREQWSCESRLEAWAAAETLDARNAAAEAVVASTRRNVIASLTAGVEAQRRTLAAQCVGDSRSPLHNRTRHGSFVVSPLKEPTSESVAAPKAPSAAQAFFGSPLALLAAIAVAAAGALMPRIAEEATGVLPLGNASDVQ
jgi:hypothetical protein